MISPEPIQKGVEALTDTLESSEELNENLKGMCEQDVKVINGDNSKDTKRINGEKTKDEEKHVPGEVHDV